jgi:Xaa-Pro aminopeptidase
VDHGLRRARLAERLGELGVESLLVTELPNVRYLSGFTGSNGALLVAPTATVFLTDGRYAEQARHEVPDVERVITSRLVPAAGVRARDVGLRRLGFEGTLPFRAHGALAEVAAGVELIAVNGAVEHLRATKDADEVAAIRRAQEITDGALEVALPQLVEGATEREIALVLEVEVRRLGAERLGFDPIVAFGEGAAEPHHRPGERALCRGDVVKLDFGALVDGYHADMTRTVALGDPPDELLAVYEVVRAAQSSAAASLTAGATAGALDAAARSVIAEAGYGDRYTHPLGHGVGLEIHEWPILRAGADDRVPAGAVITLEPGIYLPGVGGVRIEDMMYVSEDGAEALPSSTKELVVL